jgi:membrane-bound lytic murein transglycosylase D
VAPGLALGLLTGCAGLQQTGDSADTRDQAAGTVAPRSVATAELPPDLVIRELSVTGPEVPPPLEKPLPEAPYASAWKRMRSGFRLADHEGEIIERQRRYFADRPQYMARVSERAKPWMHYILEAIEARDMPSEVALVPLVESAFRPFAYSHGRASGIWQIVPGTADYMGLKRNWWYDGRRDVVAATDAALDYLARLEALYNGDWLLAFAAYNAGEGTVNQAIRRNRRAGEPTDFWHLDLPTETERYVPRILALRDLVNNPRSYGLKGLPALANEPGVAIIELEHQLDMAKAADMADVSMERLYKLNAGFNRWATPPDGPHRLVVPAASADRFQTRLAATDRDERLQWRRHEVAPGETLSEIARAYQTRVEIVREANKVSGDTIRVGQDLIVPIASESPDEYVLSASQRLESQRQTRRNGERRQYTVRQGDSFWEIARRFDVSVRELASWNGMSPGDILRPGDDLVVWAEQDSAPAANPPADQPGPSPGGAGNPTRYTVREGDSLWVIARRFDQPVQKIAQWNGISVEDTLQPGQELVVWTDSANATDTEADAQPSNKDDTAPATGKRYTVRKGDSLWHVARQHGVTVDDLTRWNELSEQATLQPGQELIVRPASRSDEAATASAASSEDAEEAGESLNYTVREGDSLYRIAREFGVTVAELRRWNNITPDSYLQPGQTLRMKRRSSGDG